MAKCDWDVPWLQFSLHSIFFILVEDSLCPLSFVNSVKKAIANGSLARLGSFQIQWVMWPARQADITVALLYTEE